MPNNPIVRYIPPTPKREKRVGIYCRVSTNSMKQLQSLTAQVSHLTRLTASMPQWILTDVYMDIATSKTASSRISKEDFEAVQIEKERRSNVIKDGNERKRKSVKYSTKKKYNQ